MKFVKTIFYPNIVHWEPLTIYQSIKKTLYADPTPPNFTQCVQLLFFFSFQSRFNSLSKQKMALETQYLMLIVEFDLSKTLFETRERLRVRLNYSLNTISTILGATKWFPNSRGRISMEEMRRRELVFCWRTEN